MRNILPCRLAGFVTRRGFTVGEPGLRLVDQRRKRERGTNVGGSRPRVGAVRPQIAIVAAMAHRLSAGHGWWVLIGGILAWEVSCADGELLSHGFDRLLERHPVWPRVAVLAVALHLINWLPERADPLAVAFHVTRRKGFRWKPLKPSFGTVN